jgi:UDP-N-acetylmuramoylalanine--D-glutamate ligase
MSIYNNQSVAVLGLSVEGIDVTRYFSGEKASVTCCDMRTESDLGATYGILRGYTDKFRLGADYLTGLDSFDIIVRSPGVSPGLPELVALKKKGKLITSLTQLFFNHCKASIIGVTGTKGKGTTSTLIYEMLKEDGKKVWLGGNIGVPLLSSVSRIHTSDIVILELSSFQLEDCTFSPHIAVVLKTIPDHLANFDSRATNYHENKEAYFAAKQTIVRYQTKDDYALLNADDPTSVSFGSLTPASVYYFSRKDSTRNAYVQDNSVYLTYGGKHSVICNLTEIHLRGLHNLENIAAASLAASVAGAGIDSIQKVARTFEGLPHRLQSVRTVDGVIFVDDSFSTTPETTIAAHLTHQKY